MEALDSLLAIKRLNALHLDGPRLFWAKLFWNDESHAPISEVGDFFLVREALRHSKPGIVIDDGSLLRGWPETEIALEQFATVVREVSWPEWRNLTWNGPKSATQFNLDRLKW